MNTTYEQLYAYCSLRKHAIDEKRLVSKPQVFIHFIRSSKEIQCTLHHTQVYVLEDGCAIKG